MTTQFDVKKHFSRLITNVKAEKITQSIPDESSDVKLEPKVTKYDIANIIKNAMKLDTLGQYEEALSWYDHALKLNPKDIDTMFKKALLLSKTAKYEQALFLFDQIIEIDPTLVCALVNRKAVMEKLGRHYGIVPLSDKQFS